MTYDEVQQALEKFAQTKSAEIRELRAIVNRFKRTCEQQDKKIEKLEKALYQSRDTFIKISTVSNRGPLMLARIRKREADEALSEIDKVINEIEGDRWK